MSMHKPDWPSINALKHLSERSTIKLTAEQKDLLAIVAQRAELLAALQVLERAIANNEPFSRAEHEQARAAIAKATQP